MKGSTQTCAEALSNCNRNATAQNRCPLVYNSAPRHICPAPLSHPSSTVVRPRCIGYSFLGCPLLCVPFDEGATGGASSTRCSVVSKPTFHLWGMFAHHWASHHHTWSRSTAGFYLGSQGGERLEEVA